MQNPKMIVLGLLAQGKTYGFEMERFIEASRMRLWAQIGHSTIYKILRDLENEGAVEARREAADRGPGRMAYALTAKGKKDFAAYVTAALRSEESVYSDRVAGLVFALSLPGEQASHFLQQTMTGLETALSQIAGEKEIHGGSPPARIVLDFYETVYKAEQKALKRALDLINEEK